MCSVSVRVILEARPAQCVKLLHSALEGRMHVGRRTLIEPCVGHGYDLSLSLATSWGVAPRHAKHLPRDGVLQLARHDFLDMAYFFQRCQIGQSPRLHNDP